MFKTFSRRDFMKGMMVGGVAAASAGVLGACSSSGSGTSDDSDITVTWSVIDVNAGNNNVGDYAEEIMDTIEEYVGHELELTWVASDALTEKNSLYMATPATMPMIMSWSGTVTGDVVSAAQNGAFVDLNDYVWDSEKYPNLSQMSTSVAGNLEVNGALIAVPRSRVLGRSGLSYRTDWAEKLGVTLPGETAEATPDDVYDLMYAFTYGDPDGNDTDDTYGMEMIGDYTGSFDIIQTWFGCGNGWAEVDGQLVPVWMQDEYFEAVDYIKKLHDDGVIVPGWYERQSDSWENACKTGEAGVFIDTMDGGKRIWRYFEADDTWTASVVDSSEAATMTLYGAVNGHTLATAGYNGYFTLSATTCDTEEKIEACLTVLDKLNDEEMLVLTQYGLEGVNYEWNDNNELVDLDTEDSALAANYAGLNQLLCYLPSTEATTVNVETDKYSAAQTEAYNRNLDYAVVNPALSYTVNSSAYSENGATLDSEASTLRTQYICGELDLDGFKSSLDNLLTKGYQDIIDEVNEQYQANQE